MPPTRAHPTPGTPPSPKRLKPSQALPQTLTNLSDSLTHPTITPQLDALLRPLSHAPNAHIHTLKSHLTSLSKKGRTVRVDTPYLRNTLRKAATGTTLAELFHGPNYQSLSFHCRPPEEIHVVGSYLLGISEVVDVAVLIPGVNEKDYLNYSYHDKRLLYLAYLARHLISTDHYTVTLLKHPLAEDPKKPCITLTPHDTSITIRILPYTTAIQPSKLAPNRRNIRPSGATSLPDNPALATPNYNASILIDLTLLQTLTAIHAKAKLTPAFTDTARLLHAWATRHALPTFPTTAYLTHLLATGLPQRAPREQLLRATLAGLRDGGLMKASISGVPIASTLSSGTLERFSEYAATTLRVVESKCAVDDPWYGVMPYLFTAARGKGVAKKPISTLFDGFVLLRHEKAEDVLKSALVDTGRVSSIEPVWPGVYGLRIASYETACRRVDSRGKSTSSEDFKSFWGDVITLRRFRDGRVAESILWQGGVNAVKEVVQYAVKQHLDNVEVTVVMGDLEDAAGVTVVDPAVARAVPTFDELSTLLRKLEGLPLSIRAVHATSPYLRHCGAFAIRPSKSTKFVQPLEIVASFESSSAWPDDAVALSAAKAAFYLAMKNKLADEGVVSSATISFIDITLAGLVFRLRIRVEREKQFIENPDDVERLVWATEKLVKHHENIRSVPSPIMGRVTRMVKRWLNAHFLFSQMGARGEELVEVLVADIFSRRDTSIPKSPFRAFCQVLHVLAEFPWEVCPLAVYLTTENDEDVDVDKEDEREVERTDFLASAQKKFSEKPGHFSVYCERNSSGEALTWFNKEYAPEPVIVTRLRKTAKASLEFVEGFTRHGTGTLGTIFEPPLKGFDLLIRLTKQNLAYHPDSVNGALRTQRRTDDTLLVGFDPTKRLLDELNERLGKYAMFLMRVNGGCEIFVLLRPSTKQRLGFSLRESAFREMVDGPNGVELVFAVKEFGAEIERIGRDLITSVEILGDS